MFLHSILIRFLNQFLISRIGAPQRTSIPSTRALFPVWGAGKKWRYGIYLENYMNNNSRSGIKKRIRAAVISGMSVMLSLSAASCSLDPASLSFRQGQNNAVTQPQEILIPVTRGTISSELSYVGNLQYNQSADMTWKTGGVIEKVNVQVGLKKVTSWRSWLRIH